MTSTAREENIHEKWFYMNSLKRAIGGRVSNISYQIMSAFSRISSLLKFGSCSFEYIITSPFSNLSESTGNKTISMFLKNDLSQRISLSFCEDSVTMFRTPVSASFLFCFRTRNWQCCWRHTALGFELVFTHPHRWHLMTREKFTCGEWNQKSVT